MTAALQALQPLFATAFTLLATPVTWLEVIAFVLAIAMVVCNIRVDPAGWPLAILSSLLYFALFWDSRLYGDASLQIFFALISLWGWRQWVRARPAVESGPNLRVLTHTGRWRVLVALALAWPATGLFLRRFTDTDVPWWDAFPTAASVIGQWLLGKKYVENWAAWVIVNLVSIALFVHKALWLTAVLYTVFVVMSVIGWRAWQGRLATAAR